MTWGKLYRCTPYTKILWTIVMRKVVQMYTLHQDFVNDCHEESCTDVHPTPRFCERLSWGKLYRCTPYTKILWTIVMRKVVQMYTLHQDFVSDCHEESCTDVHPTPRFCERLSWGKLYRCTPYTKILWTIVIRKVVQMYTLHQDFVNDCHEESCTDVHPTPRFCERLFK